MVVLTLNIFAANLADRGATIEPVEVQYPKRTALGKRVVTPQDLGKPRTIKVDTIERALGQVLGGLLHRLDGVGLALTLRAQPTLNVALLVGGDELGRYQLGATTVA